MIVCDTKWCHGMPTWKASVVINEKVMMNEGIAALIMKLFLD